MVRARGRRGDGCELHLGLPPLFSRGGALREQRLVARAAQVQRSDR